MSLLIKSSGYYQDSSFKQIARLWFNRSEIGFPKRWVSNCCFYFFWRPCLEIHWLTWRNLDCLPKIKISEKVHSHLTTCWNHLGSFNSIPGSGTCSRLITSESLGLQPRYMCLLLFPCDANGNSMSHYTLVLVPDQDPFWTTTSSLSCRWIMK